MGFSELVERVDRAAQDLLDGVAITYTPLDGTPVSVIGVFDERWRLEDPGGAGVEQITPAVWVRLEDLPVDPDDDDPLITIAGIDYTVHRREYDSIRASVMLLLHRSEAC
jgi:hypothetical protein